MKDRSPITQMPEEFMNAAWRRMAAFNRMIADIAHSNLRFGFELARARTITDVLKLQADYWQNLFKAFQGGAFQGGAFQGGAFQGGIFQSGTSGNGLYPAGEARSAPTLACPTTPCAQPTPARTRSLFSSGRYCMTLE